MAGLSGLKKKTEPTEEDLKLDAFISGAEKRVKSLEPSNKKFMRKTFSINEDIDQLIDELVVRAQNARISRSSILRIAIESLSECSSEELKEILRKNDN